MRHILVTGVDGQVGNAIKNISVQSNDQFYFTNRNKLDITNEQEVLDFIQINKIDTIINCAAYTQVDLAESEKENSYKVNMDAVGFLAKALKKNSHKTSPLFIHLSSDYVYHPNHKKVISEYESTAPQGVYASSKLDGEKLLQSIIKETIIIRTSWVYAKKGKNFVNTIARLSHEKDELKIVNDQIGSPTYAPDIASAILQIISSIDKKESKQKKSLNTTYGIYHFSNQGLISWFDFATEIVRQEQSTCKLIPVDSTAFSTAAKRPKNSRLSKDKIKNTFGIKLKDWKESLTECLTD